MDFQGRDCKKMENSRKGYYKIQRGIFKNIDILNVGVQFLSWKSPQLTRVEKAIPGKYSKIYKQLSTLVEGEPRVGCVPSVV